ncbi:hypothetical protein GCM10009846_06700 [Agrococcus versicolor]|uniref:Glycosyltransferase family 2 protein n=1 Tax=Agrococcus versicolor TaxID=501482 RepID=A0ABN3AKV5_9MICO
MLAVRNGADYLPRTLEAIAAQSVTPERVVAVDARSTDASRAHVATAGVRLVDAPPTAAYGDAIRVGVDALPAREEDEWLWLLAHDALPHPGALEAMLGTAETSPSVAVVGPKVMRAAEPDTFAEYGETLTPFGRSVRLHDGELDQGQHDGDSDALGVAESGVLVRRDVFEALGGFDPALPSVDAGLDLGVRARLAGHRVALQPAARVRRAGGPEHFRLRRVSDARRTRIVRAAQLHRRLAYAPVLAVPFHWLALLPLALVRSVAHVLAKRPGSIPAEWAAAAAAAVRIGRVVRARSRIRRTRVAAWRDLRGLRVTWRALREHRQRVGDDVDQNARVADERVGFVEGAALWVAALAVVVGVLVLAPLVGAGALTGGALLPLDGSVAGLWADATWGVRDGVGDVVGPADGFALLVAALGSIVPWAPSAAVIVLLLASAPLSAVTAWAFVRSITTSRWMPTVGAAVWAFAPTLLLSVHEGRLGAIVAHVLLPVAAGCALGAARSWRATGGAALAIAGIVACAPSLLPAVLVCWLAVAARDWRSPRVLLAVVPALLLVGPTVAWQWIAGSPLAALADPGAALASEPATPLQLLLGMPEADLGGVGLVAGALALDARWIAAVLAAPLLAMAVAAPFLRLRALVPIGVAVLGLATAVAQTHVAVAADGTETVTLWAGSGVSLLLLGLLAAATRTASVLDLRSGVPVSLVALAAALGAAPVVVLGVLTPALEPAPERALPAFVVADAASEPGVGTLVVTPLDDGAIAVRIERGAGGTLTDASTLVSTSAVGPGAAELATVAGDLVAGGGDVEAALDGWSVRYVLLADGDATLGDVAEASLAERAGLDEIGDTAFGMLWQRDVAAAQPEPVAPTAWVLLAAQLLAVAVAIVLALPSARRGARTRSRRAKTMKDWG